MSYTELTNIHKYGEMMKTAMECMLTEKLRTICDLKSQRKGTYHQQGHVRVNWWITVPHNSWPL